MATLFLIILALALYHFLYEGILLPSIRLSLRYELFGLRDELRLLKATHGQEFDGQLYAFLQTTINKALKLLPQIDLTILWEVEISDEDLKKQEAHLALLRDCEVAEVRRVHAKTLKIIVCAVLANHGGLFIYLVPVLALLFGWNKLTASVKRLFSAPESDIDDALKSGPFAHA